MTRIATYREAINEAIREEMNRDKTVVLLGEDVGRRGAFDVTAGLSEEFGRQRVFDTPINEPFILGTSIGLALTGMRPVAEIMFQDFAYVAVHMIDQAGYWRYDSVGQFQVPMVIRIPQGCVPGHTEAVEASFMRFPGVKIAIPSTPSDAKGLLKTAIRENNPVLFFEHRRLYNQEGEIPDKEYTTPFGVAAIRRTGKDATVVATSDMVNVALQAAGKLAEEGISVEVLDLRTLIPLDEEAILESVRKTGRLVTVEEGHLTGGTGAEIASRVVKRAFQYLRAPIERVASLDIPSVEDMVRPDVNKLVATVRSQISS